MNIELLEKALDNDENLSTINTNIQEIKNKKNDILQNLGVNRLSLKEYHSKLKEYMYVENIEELKEGHIIRYINLANKDNIKLSNCAIICNILINKSGIGLVIKIFNNKFITLFLDKILLFKKFSNEEKMLLNALKLLSK